MKIITSLLLTLSFSTVATECNISPNLLSAYYDVTQQVPAQQTSKKQQIHLMELHRNNSSILKRNIRQGINDIWMVNGERISVHRAFDQYKHTIEYQSNELNYQPKQQDILQIVATPSRKNMRLIASANSGCELEQQYTLSEGNNSYQLIWMPALQLVKSFQVKTPTVMKQWTLTKYSNDTEIISSLFTQYSNYQTTDYADVGDNESIPFLATMINQGFSTQAHSAHYQSNDHANGDGHDH